MAGQRAPRLRPGPFQGHRVGPGERDRPHRLHAGGVRRTGGEGNHLPGRERGTGDGAAASAEPAAQAACDGLPYALAVRAAGVRARAAGQLTLQYEDRRPVGEPRHGDTEHVLADVRQAETVAERRFWRPGPSTGRRRPPRDAPRNFRYLHTDSWPGSCRDGKAPDLWWRCAQPGQSNNSDKCAGAAEENSKRSHRVTAGTPGLISPISLLTANGRGPETGDGWPCGEGWITVCPETSAGQLNELINLPRGQTAPEVPANRSPSHREFYRDRRPARRRAAVYAED